MAEIDYTQDLLVRLSESYHPRGIFYRRNVGVARPVDRDYVMRFGIPGQADIGGIMCGYAIEIETKMIAENTRRKKTKTEEAQANWRDAVRQAGGWYFRVWPGNEDEMFLRLDLIFRRHT